ncbi:uncharacterized protein BXZ73DRAFT_99753 [Epithele typhae]|uniref:uncharacterized protein n=1 Tax=Epithele typhae TaxID=378194 RepID=UPI0020089030|nr:uncharacterized protein BXZ73DRAFT_99753 [Epithele typhae]KAH9939077.1 hypothetical protein BXZ73DRAFT_99753 [Epithele typhae]
MDFIPLLIRPTLKTVYVTKPVFLTRNVNPHLLRNALSSCPGLLHLTISAENGIESTNSPASLSPQLLLPSLQTLAIRATEKSTAFYLNSLTFGPHTSIELRVPNPSEILNGRGMLPDRDLLSDFARPVVSVRIADYWHRMHSEAFTELRDANQKRVLRVVLEYKLHLFRPPYDRLLSGSESVRGITRLTVRTVEAPRAALFDALPHLTFLDVGGPGVGTTLSILKATLPRSGALAVEQPLPQQSTLRCPRLDTLVATFDHLPDGLRSPRLDSVISTFDRGLHAWDFPRANELARLRGWNARCAVRALVATLETRAASGARLSRLVWGVRSQTVGEVERETGLWGAVSMIPRSFDRGARAWVLPGDEDAEEDAVDGFELDRLRGLVNGSVERRS